MRRTLQGGAIGAVVGALAALGLAGVGVPAASAATTLHVPAQYSTIQAAVNAAQPGDTIQVAAGTYSENVTITTSNITLTGNNANIDPNTGVRRAESVIAQPSVSTQAVVTETGVTGVVINGFTISDSVPRTTVLPGVNATGASGDTWDNDIVTGNGRGIQVNTVGATTATPLLITRDRFVTNNNDPTNQGSGTAVATSNTTNNITVSSNTFINNANQAALPYFENGVINSQGCNIIASTICTGWTVTQNTDTHDSTHSNNFMVLQALSGASVTHNTVTYTNPTNSASPAFYVDTGTTGGTIANNTITGDTNQAGVYFDNIYRSGGTGVTVTANTMTNDQYGVWVADDGGPGNGTFTNLSITSNTITGATAQAMDLWHADGFNISKNTMSSDGRGVTVTYGNSFHFASNTMTSPNPPLANSTGIGVYQGTGFTVTNNTLSNQAYGVYLYGPSNTGFFLTANKVSGTTQAGIAISQGASQGQVHDNTLASVFPAYDALDASVGAGTQGTANLWFTNHCLTSLPYGLCPVGYLLGAADGGVFAFGASTYQGSMAGQHLNAPIVGIVRNPRSSGYWLVGSDGGVFAFATAFYGSMGGQPLNAPIVGMAATPDGGGYWLVGKDGGVFAFGDAGYYGGLGGQPLPAPISGIGPTFSGHGYELVGQNGAVYPFGDAPSLGGLASLSSPAVAIQVTMDNGGYWIAQANGAVTPFGDAPNKGSMAGRPLNKPIVGMVATPDSDGYDLVGADGGVYSFGNAPYLGSMGNRHLNAPMVGMSIQ
jgi:parallel beta-helix repeat protein